MKLMLSALALVFVASLTQAAPPTEAEVLKAYTRVADAYPRLVADLLEQGNDTVACQKAKVLDLTREGYESPEMGKKLAKYNPWVYRNFTSSFKELRVVMNYCHTRTHRARAVEAAKRMAAASTLESIQ